MNGEGPVDLERRVREQEALLEIGLELAATLDLRRVLSLALTKAEEFCKAETSSIWELDEGEYNPHAWADEVVALHDRCRRYWYIQQIRADQAAVVTSSAPRGAYARREAATR